MPQLAVSELSALGQGVASAFAIGDFLLLGFTGAALILTRRWRVPQWRRLTVGIDLLAGTDLIFAARLAGPDGAFASAFDYGWVAGLTALAVVRPTVPRREAAAARQPVGPALCTLVALGVIVLDHYHRVADGPLWLAVAALLLGVGRTIDSARLAEAERIALTEELTRVGNRRRLFRDLGAASERGEALRLALFDLNGFKAHNDARMYADKLGAV
jgi:hypothetical protein